MIKKLFQICSVLSLLVVFSVVSAKAQTVVKDYRAQIPFDFNVGQKSYQAGDYVFHVSKISMSCVALSLRDNDKNNLKTVLVRIDGNVSKDSSKLVFDRYDNQRFLTKMLMPEMGLSISRSKGKKQIAGERGEPRIRAEATAVTSK